MNMVLSAEFQSFIASRVASGAYPSEQAVLRSAFDLLERREKLLAQIDEGARQLQTGEYTDYAEHDADRFLADIAKLASRLPENGTSS
jgi:putative addiction module CopG family antidote